VATSGVAEAATEVLVPETVRETSVEIEIDSDSYVTVGTTAWESWTTSNSATSDIIWGNWSNRLIFADNSNSTGDSNLTISTSTGSTAWTSWNSSQYSVWREWTDEERVAARVRQNVRDSRRVRATVAEQLKGMDLLRQVLNDLEWEDYRRHGSVRVMGSDEQLYEVGDGNLVYRIRADGTIEGRCWHVSHQYCLADRIAGVVLALRADASAYERYGNTNYVSDELANRVRARRAFRRAS